MIDFSSTATACTTAVGAEAVGAEGIASPFSFSRRSGSKKGTTSLTSFAAIASSEFNAGNSDSCLVWAASQPTPNNSYDFSCADRIFSFMAQHNMTYAHVNAVMQVSNC